MEKRHFSLEQRENSKLVRIFQIVFGILCVAIAVYWLIFNITSEKRNSNLWVTVIFLAGFGGYQVLSGLGKTSRFIETENDILILKQNSTLPGIKLKAIDIEKIEIFPLSLVFLLKSQKKIILRFGISYPDVIDPAKEGITDFAEMNSIPIENKNEDLQG